jgi:hypothetical protein
MSQAANETFPASFEKAFRGLPLNEPAMDIPGRPYSNANL